MKYAARTIANMTPEVSAPQRSSAVARSIGHIERSSPMPRRERDGHRMTTPPDGARGHAGR